MNKIQEKLIKILGSYGFIASWASSKTVLDIDGGHSDYEYVDLIKGDAFAVLEFDDPETLQGCTLCPSEPELKQAYEIALGVYYASIGGASVFSTETNRYFNSLAKKYNREKLWRDSLI